jgi:HD-GYP domain-containing protein (c-di-GMP phosphodiesterase class II)
MGVPHICFTVPDRRRVKQPGSAISPRPWESTSDLRRTQRQLASAVSVVATIGEAHSALTGSLTSKEQAKLLGRLVTSTETRDPYLHSRRVARHSWMIAKQMGLPRAEMTQIRAAAALHDVGKVTPKAILHKPASLTDGEYGIIKMHPGDGAQMVEVLRDPQLTSMVRHHHERLDGTGYPHGLRGEPIPPRPVNGLCCLDYHCHPLTSRLEGSWPRA